MAMTMGMAGEGGEAGGGGEGGGGGDEGGGGKDGGGSMGGGGAGHIDTAPDTPVRLLMPKVHTDEVLCTHILIPLLALLL